MNPHGKHRKLLSFIMSVARSFTGGRVEGEERNEDAGEDDFGWLLQDRDPRAPSGDPQTRLAGGIARHVMMKYRPTPKKKNPSRVCRVCKARGYRRETAYYCASCKAPLHLTDCFRIYHTKQHFEL